MLHVCVDTFVFSHLPLSQLWVSFVTLSICALLNSCIFTVLRITRISHSDVFSFSHSTFSVDIDVFRVLSLFYVFFLHSKFFTLSQLPLNLVGLNGTVHPVKVGVSDAYYQDRVTNQSKFKGMRPRPLTIDWSTQQPMRWKIGMSHGVFINSMSPPKAPCLIFIILIICNVFIDFLILMIYHYLNFLWEAACWITIYMYNF